MQDLPQTPVTARGAQSAASQLSRVGWLAGWLVAELFLLLAVRGFDARRRQAGRQAGNKTLGYLLSVAVADCVCVF